MEESTMEGQTDARTLDVRGKQVPWTVNDRGIFHAEVDGVHYSDDTLDALRTKLVAATKRKAVKVHVPFVASYKPQFGSISLRRAVVAGRHQSTGNLLIKWESGPSQQHADYHDALRDLSDEEFEEGARLLLTLNAADAAWKRFKTAREVNLRRTVDLAIEEATAKLTD
jgi:hypothetical protein